MRFCDGCPDYEPVPEVRAVKETPVYLDFPNTLGSEAVLNGEYRAFVTVIQRENNRVCRLFQTSSLRDVAHDRLSSVLTPKLEELVSRYPWPEYEIAIAQGTLESIAEELPQVFGWTKISPEDLTV